MAAGAAVTEAETRLVYGIGVGLEMRGDMSISRKVLAGLCAAAVAATAFAVPAAQAQTPSKKRYAYTSSRVANNHRARTRVTVAPRSFLDPGTEVLPGEGKFTDYAFPASPTAGYYTSVVTSTGGKVGWDRSPLMNPSELPGGFLRW
jgi:hypothetical protein